MCNHCNGFHAALQAERAKSSSQALIIELLQQDIEKMKAEIETRRARTERLENALLPLALTHPHLVPDEFKPVSLELLSTINTDGEKETTRPSKSLEDINS